MHDVKLEKVPTGRTHTVNNGGVAQNQKILGPDGEPEYEYVLSAHVDGHRVALERYSAGYVEHLASLEHTAIDQATADEEKSGSSSSSRSRSRSAAG